MQYVSVDLVRNVADETVEVLLFLLEKVNSLGRSFVVTPDEWLIEEDESWFYAGLQSIQNALNVLEGIGLLKYGIDENKNVFIYFTDMLKGNEWLELEETNILPTKPMLSLEGHKLAVGKEGEKEKVVYLEKFKKQ